MHIDVVSVFPEYFHILELSLLGKAQQSGLLQLRVHNLRDWTHDVHHSVDDTPVGGGAGMVMKPETWAECLDEVLPQTAATSHAKPILIFPNPSAPLFTQEVAQELSQAPSIAFGCGRYEGIDARVADYYRTIGMPDINTRCTLDVREYSIGDYVLNGGEVAVCVMIEAITRLIPGFMGNPESIVKESYTGEPLLEYPQYTRPTTWRGISVPPVLTSGDHAKVDRFRRDKSLEKTSVLRPDLIQCLDCHALDKADRKILIALGWNVSGAHPVRSHNTH